MGEARTTPATTTAVHEARRTWGSSVLSWGSSVLIALALLAPGGAGGQMIQNSASGGAQSVSLDLSGATVTLNRTPILDPQRSLVTADPARVAADGIAMSTITVILHDGSDQPLAGKSILLSSDRGAVDLFAQPSAPTDSNGVATGTISSSTPGVAMVTATVVTDSVMLDMRPRVAFTQGVVLRLTKVADRSAVVNGGIVRYTVMLRNLSALDVLGVTVDDRMPVGFRYVKGSARAGGVPLPDPPLANVLAFDLGTIPGFKDTNGNGQADPGESGYVELSYQLVVSSGVSPGKYRNTAVARDACESCLLSNSDEAVIAVEPDELFSLGSILGRVFEDRNQNGLLEHDEPGVAKAMVALDDGSYALTDTRGLYHFPAVQPGRRLIKVQLSSVPGPAEATDGVSRLVDVTPGLLAKANFGIVAARDTVRVGEPAYPGLEIASETHLAPIDVVGTMEGPALLVNGQPDRLPSSDIRIRPDGLAAVVELHDNRLPGPITFHTRAGDASRVGTWQLAVLDAMGDTVRVLAGAGGPPEIVNWDGERTGGSPIQAGNIYFYQLRLAYLGGAEALSPVRTLGIKNRGMLALAATEAAFESGQPVLTPDARRSLRRIADLLRQFPNLKLAIESSPSENGSSENKSESNDPDSTGFDQQNDLSRRRALTAAQYLVRAEKIPRTRIIVSGGGEGRSATSGALALDETLILDPHREVPQVWVNSIPIGVDPQGRFATQIEASAHDTLEVELRDPQGRALRQRIELPYLEILGPQGTIRLPFGAEQDGFRAELRQPFPDSSAALFASDARVPVLPEIVANGRLMGRTDPGNTVVLALETIPVAADGSFSTDLPLHLGDNTFGLLVRNPAGTMRVANLHLSVTDKDEKDGTLIAVEPVPDLTVIMPPTGTRLVSEMVTLSGMTDPENKVTVNGVPVPLDADGRFRVPVPLAPGRNPLRIEAIDPEGRVALVERELMRDEPGLFFLALADGMVGQLSGQGHLEGAGEAGETGLYSGGRVAFYLKGQVLGRYLITSALDLANEDQRLFPDVDRDRTGRLLTNLDPDTMYPVYGDSSTVMYDAHRPGRFYLALDGDALDATVGSISLALGETELAPIQRTLYGGRVHYQSLARTPAGDARTAVTVFAAEPKQRSVRDELRGTGGSVYYLSHRDLIEGSEQVSIAIRDPRTGLVQARVPQLQNIDYTIKYREGRIVFHRPVSSVVEDGSLISGSVFPGSPVVVEVAYETAAGETFDRMTAGGRVRQRLGALAIGATVLQDEAGAGQYELGGTDIELRVGEGARLLGEYAASRGSGAGVYLSPDGGLTYLETPGSAAREGRAWKAAAELDFGTWLHTPGRPRVGGYVKRVKSGFFSNGNLEDRGFQKLGATASLAPTASDRFAFRWDREEPRDRDTLAAVGPGVNELTSLLWAHDVHRWGVASEFQRRTSEAIASDSLAPVSVTAQSVASAALWAKPFDRWTARLERQQTLAGPDNDQTRASLRYQALKSLSLEGRGALGTQGRSAQGGAELTLGAGSSLYLNRQLGEDAAGRRSTTTLGTQVLIAPGSRAYTEYQWEQADSNHRRVSLMGVQREWERGQGTTLFASGEHGKVESAALTSTRTAVAGGVSYTSGAGMRAMSRGEVRLDSGDVRRVQTFTSHSLEMRLSGDLVVLGSYRFGRTRDRLLDRTEARFEERSAGLAYRPLYGDRINALARYTRLDDDRRAGFADSSIALRGMDVVSAEAIVELGHGLSWSGKGATRILRDSTGEGPVARTHSYLGVSRVDYPLRPPFGLGVEYRVLGQTGAGDRRQGWLDELRWEVTEQFRVGVGYNFTDFSDDEFSRNDYSVRGWFARATGRF